MVSVGHRHLGAWSAAAFKRRYDVTLPDHQARKRRKVHCPHCEKALSEQYMPIHIRHVHHMLPVFTDQCISDPPCKRPRLSHSVCSSSPNRYDVRMTDIMVCPVPDCPAWTKDPWIFRKHLCVRHPMCHFTFSGKQGLVQCPRCGLYLNVVTLRHFQSHFCQAQTARREYAISYSRLVQAVKNATPFLIGGNPVEYVEHFRYLGRMLSQDDSDDMAAFVRLQTARKVWGRFSILLRTDEVSAVTMGRFYRTIIQQTLLFASATWVLSTVGYNRLARFQARCARGIAHRHIQRRPDGTWIHPNTDAVLDECGLQPLQVYIHRRRSHLMEHYAQSESSSYRRCLSLPKVSRSGLWWQQSS